MDRLIQRHRKHSMLKEKAKITAVNLDGSVRMLQIILLGAL